MNHSPGGSAHGSGGSSLSADASVGVGYDEDDEPSPTFTYSGSLTDIVFTQEGNYWVVRKTITNSSLSGDAYLNHPTKGYKLDGAHGSGSTTVSNFQNAVLTTGG